MKFFSPAPAFFLAVLTALAGEAAGPASPAAPSLRFDQVPLGNVALILSARFGAPVTIAAHARTPITGDFSGLDLAAALAAAGRQAGLTVRPLGADPGAGYVLELPPSPDPAEVARGLQAAARRRAELLRQRTVLLQEAPP